MLLYAYAALAGEQHLPVSFTLLTGDEDLIARRVAPLPYGFPGRVAAVHAGRAEAPAAFADGLVPGRKGNSR